MDEELLLMLKLVAATLLNKASAEKDPINKRYLAHWRNQVGNMVSKIETKN